MFYPFHIRQFEIVCTILTVLVLYIPLTGKTKDAEVPLPYSLYTGMDLQVKLKDGTFPIVGFSRKSITITRNGVRDPLPTKSNITYAVRQKLSDKWVDLEILETERFISQLNAEISAYSSAISQADREQIASEDHALDPSANEIERASDPVEPLLPNGNDNVFVEGLGSHQALSRSLDDMIHNPEAYFDSLKVMISLETDELLKGVYLVLVARIDSPATEPDARPLVQVVGQLKPGVARQVKAVFKNLPEGFNLLGMDVHIYSLGEEIPYQGSRELKKLTEEEAFKYSLGKYIATGGEVQPALFRGLPASELSALLTEKEITRIKADFIVHPDGSTALYYLNSNDERVTRGLVALLEKVRFLPAMENGKPTEAKISLELSSLVE